MEVRLVALHIHVLGGKIWLIRDGSTAMKPEEVKEALKLNQLKDKVWNVVPSCATSGEGLIEGLVRPWPSLLLSIYGI